MNKVNRIKDQLACEVHQKYELQKILILKILGSRRLLSEHLEILEEVIPFAQQNDIKQSNLLTLATTSTAMVSSYLAFSCFSSNLRYLIPCAAGIVPVMYLNKKFKIQQREACEENLKDFIKTLDDYEFSVKKATNFLNDAHYIKSQADNLKRCNQGMKISTDLANLIKRVIRALYCFVKYLEYCFKIDSKFVYYYQDVDDVDNCPLMIETDDGIITPSKFKEMFALFAYVQSYVLYRLALIFATNMDEGKFITMKRICDMTSKIKHQTLLLPHFMLIQKEEAEIQENIQKLIDIESNKTAPRELLQIRSSTVDFTLKALSLIFQLKEYQEIIMELTNNHQNADNKNLDDILNSLDNIGSQLASCTDEQSRLMILVKKYLNKDTEELKLPEKAINPEEAEEHQIVGEDYHTVQKDDFFYVDLEQENIGNDSAEKEYYNLEDLDEENLQVKLTKQCFKPVLAQLRERIVPIGDDMKERETKVLKEKGIEFNEEELNGDSMENNDLSDHDSGSDAEDVGGFKSQRKYSQNKFNENRDFLQSKNQINLLDMFPNQNKFHALEEDILE